MKNKYLFLTKNLLLFAISGVLPKLLAFIIVPIYTSYLSTSEYGIYDLIQTTVELLTPIFALRIHEAVIRFSLDDSENPSEVFSVGLKTTCLGSLIIGICTFVFYLAHIFDGVYLLAFFSYYFIGAISNVFTRFCRAINKTGIITIGAITNSVIMYSATLVFLLCFNWGINGFLFANILGIFSNGCVCFVGAKLYRFIRVSTSKELCKKMIKFSTPLIFGALAWWINNASDRYIVSMICGVSASGLYAISYKIPSLLAVVQEIFHQAWSVSAIKDFDKEDKDGFISNIYNMLHFSMIFVASVLMLLNIPIARLIFSNNFFEAWQYVPPLLISLYFNAMSMFYDGLFLAIKNTRGIAISTIIGAIINTVLNFILIYLWGPYGAAFATMIGFGCAYLTRRVLAKNQLKINKHLARENISIVVLFAQMLISFLGDEMFIYQTIAVVIIISLYLKEEQKMLSLLKDRFFKKISK